MKTLVQQTVQEDPINPVDDIIQSTKAKIFIFLSEISVGTTNYRSLHNLTQQVEHQYHGRFLIELIQNAHDALPDISHTAGRSRIAISLIENDSEFGTLYIANDGQPFTASNFQSLSQLGQSDKDPQKSIGNKGIGFRSVLEICSKPEIYSRISPDSKNFDGYCFGFDPNIISSLAEPILKLKDGIIPISPLTHCPLVDWSVGEIERFKSQVEAKGSDWLLGELEYLSPYLLPIPIKKTRNSNLVTFEDQGYSTVVRLVLKSAETKKYVQEELCEIAGPTVLFLEKLSSLSITNLQGDSHTYSRASKPYPGLNRGSLVTISDSDVTSQFASWTKAFLVHEASEEFQAAVKALPGKWPEITEISLSLAVETGDSPKEGKYSIYLPTLLSSGSATHINAPFFGDMSRTSINFDDAFNAHLLEASAELALDVVRNTLAGKGSDEARLIVDLLCPLGNDKASIERWNNVVSKAVHGANASIDSEKLFLTQNGWRPLNTTSVLPPFPPLTTPVIVTPERLRKHATFDIFHSELETRIKQIEAFIGERYDTGIYPTKEHIAETLEKIAEEILSSNEDWNGFWKDVMALLRQSRLSPNALNGYTVIIGNDGQLHASSETSTVFFYPKQGTADDGEIGGEGQTLEVPPSLRAHVAFLSDEISVYEEKTSTQTLTRRFLANGLVTQFRIEDIFTTVLQKHVPELPVSLHGRSSNLCRDILLWGMQLIRSAIARGRASEAIYKLGKILPVPCIGGWYPLSESSFGPEWPDTAGDLLHEYLNELATPSSGESLKKVLLPPSHKLWRSQGLPYKDILASAGVFDGLRLEPVSSNSWQSIIYATPTSFKLPSDPPSRITKAFWQRYREHVSGKSPYQSTQQYIVRDIQIFPGFENFGEVSTAVKTNLSELILYSLSKWADFEQITVFKRTGEMHRVFLKSPLKFFLETASWLAIDDPSGTVLAVPNERWYVHEKTLVSRFRNFAHLNPLPLPLAKRLARSNELADALISLGMPQFDVETITDTPKLIEALTSSVGSEIVSDSNVLLGQIRDAWRVFRPTASLGPLQELVVRRSSRQLERFSPTEDTPAYLPDVATYVSELESFDLPVITIEPSDAKSLKDWFIQAYGSRVQLTSELSLKPFVSQMPWKGANAVPLQDSDLNWFVVPLLSIIAFWGPQPRGVNSVAFQERLDLLKVAKLDWVPELSVGLMKENQKIVETSIPALWHKETKTIIASEICRNKLDELSAALAEAINRDDLEFPLKFALTHSASDNFTTEGIWKVLASLKISEEHLHEVQTHLRGDIGNTIKWLEILYRLIRPDVDSRKLQDATSEEEIIAISKSLSIDDSVIVEAVSAARSSSDIFDFGFSIQNVIDAIPLPAWNEIMREYDLPPLRNRSSSTQIQAVIEEVSAVAKKIIAYVLKSSSVSLSFGEMFQQFRDISLNENLTFLYWEIDFPAGMELFANLLSTWKADEHLIMAIQTSQSMKDLYQKLNELGMDIDTDPDNTYRRNDQLIEATANRLEKIRLAWFLKNISDSKSGDWKNESASYKQLVLPHLQRDGFLHLWDFAAAFKHLKNTDLFKDIPEFWAHVITSENLEMLQTALQLSENDVHKAEDELADIRKEINRKKDLVKVCGREFDSSEENLPSLWAHIEESISDENIGAFEPIDLRAHALLNRIKKQNTARTKKPSIEPKPKTSRPAKALNELIGLAGEIFVYRMLQSKYGSDVISASAWVSENSKMRFPHNECSDSKGYDITFTYDNILYRVEVKSTNGEDESFSLGSSEIRLAMDLAKPRKRAKEVFILVHVKNALSEAPSFTVLPNPYNDKYKDQFIIEEAEARVRYHVRPKLN